MKKDTHFKFRLYVTGEAHNSIQAITNLKALCRTHLAYRYDIEIVDVVREPKKALAEGVFLTPMLVKYSPTPFRRIVGNLNDQAPLLQMLEIPPS